MSEGGSRRFVLTRDHVWPIGIAVGLLIMVLVNIAFIVVAVGGQDEVAESYVSGER